MAEKRPKPPVATRPKVIPAVSVLLSHFSVADLGGEGAMPPPPRPVKISHKS